LRNSECEVRILHKLYLHYPREQTSGQHIYHSSQFPSHHCTALPHYISSPLLFSSEMPFLGSRFQVLRFHNTPSRCPRRSQTAGLGSGLVVSSLCTSPFLDSIHFTSPVVSPSVYFQESLRSVCIPSVAREKHNTVLGVGVGVGMDAWLVKSRTGQE
jgi:hypothetical protein